MYVDSSPDLEKISTYDPHFSKKWLCQAIMGIFFEIEIFVLKYVLNHSESIPTKKFFFRPKIFVFAIFWPKMAKNKGFLKIFGRKKTFFNKIFVPSFRTFYCGSFELSYLCVPLTFVEIFPSEQIRATSAGHIRSS